MRLAAHSHRLGRRRAAQPQPQAAPRRGPPRAVQAARRLQLGLAPPLRPDGRRGPHEPRVPQRGRQHRPRRPQRRRQVDHRRQYRPPRRHRGAHRALRHRSQHARRARRHRQRYPAPAQAALLRPSAPAGDRRGRISVLQQPPRRPPLQYRLKPQPAELHHNHHQPPLRRVGRGLPQRRLRRRPGRPPRPQREIIAIDGDSYRRKEAEERQKQRSAERRRRRGAKARRQSADGGTQDPGAPAAA